MISAAQHRVLDERATKTTTSISQAYCFRKDEAISKYPNGCISDELMVHFPNHGVQTISPRFAPLIRKGFIEDTGERRKSSSGRSQRVMKVIK